MSLSAEMYFNVAIEQDENGSVRFLDEICEEMQGKAFFVSELKERNTSKKSIGRVLFQLYKANPKGYLIRKTNKKTYKGHAWKIEKL
jgi:hypothetical protein